MTAPPPSCPRDLPRDTPLRHVGRKFCGAYNQPGTRAEVCARPDSLLEHAGEGVFDLGLGLLAEVRLALGLGARGVLGALRQLLARPHHVGRDVVHVGVDRRALECACEYAVQLQAEAGPDLNQRGFACGFGLGDLVVANPNVAVEDVEGERMVHKRLALPVALGRPKRLLEHFLEELKVGFRVERCVEHEERAREEQVVAGELELACRVDVLDQKLCTGTKRCPRHPQVKVLVLSGLEVQSAVAPPHLRNLVDHAGPVLALHLRVFGAVREQLSNVQHQVPETVRDSARSNDQHSLLVSEPPSN
mmetsp:Transcript_44917/g.105411  ORF Transcript_44917/g.105411 Transcript_44917/m.105411 type:complete len:305 (+) Transcript_44917:56-970(+)